MATLREIAGKIEATIPEIEALMGELELLAAQEADVLINLRVFNGGAKDIRGRELKPYTEAYAKKREKAGLQTARKDLIFNKDSSVIFSNIRVGLTQNKPALGFIKEKGAEIGGYQEKQNNTKIFQLNDEERRIVKEKVREHLFKRLREITQQWR